MKQTKLATSIALSLLAVALHAPANAENADAPIEKLEVRGTAAEDNNLKMPVLVDGKLFEGKKTTVVDFCSSSWPFCFRTKSAKLLQCELPWFG